MADNPFQFPALAVLVLIKWELCVTIFLVIPVKTGIQVSLDTDFRRYGYQKTTKCYMCHTSYYAGAVTVSGLRDAQVRKIY